MTPTSSPYRRWTRLVRRSAVAASCLLPVTLAACTSSTSEDDSAAGPATTAASATAGPTDNATPADACLTIPEFQEALEVFQGGAYAGISDSVAVGDGLVCDRGYTLGSVAHGEDGFWIILKKEGGSYTGESLALGPETSCEEARQRYPGKIADEICS